MLERITGTSWTNAEAMAILQTSGVCAWLNPDADTYYDVCPYWADAACVEFAVLAWTPLLEDEYHAYTVYVRGDTLGTLRWRCTCGGADTPDPCPPDVDVVPCRHAIVAWASMSVDRARQVADWARRAWDALQTTP